MTNHINIIYLRGKGPKNWEALNHQNWKPESLCLVYHGKRQYLTTMPKMTQCKNTSCEQTISKRRRESFFWFSTKKQLEKLRIGKYLSRVRERNVVHTTMTLPFKGMLTSCTEQTDQVELEYFANMIVDLDSNSNNETQVHNSLF